MERVLFVLLLVLCGVTCHAEDTAISTIVGKYVYDNYRLTLRNGRVVGFESLGARGGEAEIKSDYTIILNMNMVDGRKITEIAKILELQINGTRGYLVQKWPNMTYTVRTEIELTANGINYTNRFDNPNDLVRYGTIERATLKRTQFSNPVLQRVPANDALKVKP